MSIAGVITVIACLRYELSIPLGKNEKEASASFTLSLFFTLIFTVVVLAVVPVLKGKIAQWFKAPELKMFLWLLLFLSQGLVSDIKNAHLNSEMLWMMAKRKSP
jgi:hypothetical protein